MRYCSRLLQLKQPFDKGDAIDAFLGIVSEISDDAAGSDKLTARSQYALLQVWRDVSKGAPDPRALPHLELIWSSVRRRGFAADDDTIYLSEDNLHPSALPADCVTERRGWWTVDRADFMRVMNRKAVSGLKETFCRIFGFGEDPDVLGFLADESHHALTAKLIWPSSRLVFESQQYSARVQVDLKYGRSEPLQSGRTSFVWPHPYDAWRLAWEDQSWTPLINGFLVAGE